MPPFIATARTKRISVSLSPALHARLEHYATRTGIRSVSLLANILLERAIAELPERPLELRGD